ncbi:hypothetical protein GCM10010273_58940 [Streptomyces lavendulocolor]
MSYRVRRGPWGIAADLTAGASVAPEPARGAEHVAGRVWLDLAPVLRHPHADRSGVRIAGGEAAWLRHGAALAAPAVEAGARRRTPRSRCTGCTSTRATSSRRGRRRRC